MTRNGSTAAVSCNQNLSSVQIAPNNQLCRFFQESFIRALKRIAEFPEVFMKKGLVHVKEEQK